MAGIAPDKHVPLMTLSNRSDVESLRSFEYVGNYYSKDYKYLSPQVLQKDKGSDALYYSEGSKLGSCKLFARLWLTYVMKGLKQFLYEGSLHGVKYIFEPAFSRKERFIWIVIVVISILICAVNIIQLFCKWHSTPFVNVIDSLPTPIWAVPFPTVVVCPQLHVKLSAHNISELNELQHFFASLVCPQMSHKKIALNHRLSPAENIKMMEFIIKGSPKCTDVIKSCYWKPTHEHEWFADECCEKMFKPIFTDYGLCYAFNSLPLNGMTNATLNWQKTFNQNTEQMSLNWSLDGGYPKVFPPDPSMIPLRVVASGEVHGLGVELYLNTSDHQFECDGKNMGFNVLISSPTDHVYTSTVLRLPMNKMTTIEVSPITYKTDFALRALQPYVRQCYFQDERKLTYFELYTDSNCKQDMWISEVKEKCNCVLFHWPKYMFTGYLKFNIIQHSVSITYNYREKTNEGILIKEPICSTKSDVQCMVDVRGKFEEQMTYAYYEDSQEERKPQTSASCHPACNDVLYSSQVFYSDLTSIPGRPEPKWDTKKGEITRINVHFYDDIFLGQHRHTQYDDYYFAGAIGGLLSLFLGFSIISVAELVYFVILKPVHMALKEILRHE